MKEKHDVPLEEISKSQRKRDMTALQKLGEALVALPMAQLVKIPLEPSLSDAIHEARSLESHGAIRRQLQYIVKLMRHIDNITLIEDALKKIHRR